MNNAVTRVCAWVSLALLTYGTPVTAQTVEWFAGGRLIDNLPAAQTSVMPGSLTAAPDGTIYLVDWFQHQLLRRDPTNSMLYTMPPGATLPLNSETWGYVERVFRAPNGTTYVVALSVLYRINPATGELVRVTPLSEFQGSPVAACRNRIPSQFAMDSNGALYWTDPSYHAVCKMVSTLPFPIVSSDPGFAGDGGPVSSAKLNGPTGIAIDAANNIYVADQNNNRIRKIAAGTGIITTVAGNGNTNLGGENVVATTSPLASPSVLAVDAAGSLYISEFDRYRVRRLDFSTGRIFTHAGTGVYSGTVQASGVPATSVPIGYVKMLAIEATGDLLISDGGQRLVRRVTRSNGIISTIAGNGDIQYCGQNVVPRDACISTPRAVAVDSNGDVYIADSGNRRVHKVSAATGLLTTVAGRYGPDLFSGAGGPATNAVFGWDVESVALDAAGNLFVASSARIHRVDKVTGILTTIAGTGEYGFSGDGGPALAARIGAIRSLTVDSAGSVYFSDLSNNLVRKIAAGTGIITTFAGTGITDGPLGDGGLATAASLSFPSKLGFDKAGNLLVVDYSHRRIRKVDKSTRIITTVIGNGTWGDAGDGVPATSASTTATTFALDPAGNIILVGNGNPVRRVDAETGIIRSVAVLPGKTPEGFFIGPNDLAFDSNGVLYDAASQSVLKITGLPYTPADTTPPVIQPTVSGLLAASGWYIGDAQVTWSVTDAESTVTSKSGCDATLVTQDTSGVSFTCTATSSGGTSSSSVTLKRDATAPTLNFGAVSPAANASGWSGSDVSIDFTTSDDTSGVATTSLPSPLAFSNEGIGMTQSVLVTDVAGNSATFESVAVSIDKTPPVVTADVTGTPGSNDWYVGNVQVGWSINEIPGSIESSTGCDTTNVTLDTVGTTFTCSVTSAGGTTSRSTTVKVDSIAPTLTFGAPSPAANAGGWNNSNVDVAFTADDVTSGLASTSQANPLTFTNEGVGLSQSVTVTDVAGNSATFHSPALNIDKTPPLVAPVVAGTLGNNGWYRGDTTVDWSITEFPASIISSEGCGTGSVTADTSGVGFTCSVTSGGGTTGNFVTIKRDATPPVLTFGTYTPAPNVNGWNKTNVSVPFTRSDAMSGLGTTSATSPLTFNTEGAGQTKQVIVTDLAGNSATFTTATLNIDKTAPYAEMETPEDSATYSFYSNVPADFVCEDLSLVSCTAPVALGAFINTASAGSKTFKVTAKDQAGFTTNHTHTYTVASGFNFDGFLAPLRAPNTLNLVTRGSLVPLRWRLPDGRGGFVTNPASFVSATVSTFTCSGSSVALNDVASGAEGLGFDAASGTFTYNWQTNAGWTGCRKLVIKLKDNSTHEARFKFQ